MRITALTGKPILSGLRYDLARLGYTNDEFVLEGVACSYADGTERPFATRLVVRRPVDAERSNGTAFVEWLNVSGGTDLAIEWAYAHRHLMREGYSWVGVSAQRAGVEGGGIIERLHLKLADAERYESLSHPGDAYAYDIFTQAAQALRENPRALLGGREAHRVLAGGQSQSATFLTTYVNVVDENAKVFDGYLIHGRAAWQAGLDGSLYTTRLGDVAGGEAIRQLREAGLAPIRDDVRVPVLTLQSECDVAVLKSFLIRQPDTDRHRLWEVAGASHADTYLLAVQASDNGTLSATELARALAPADSPPGMPTATSINSGPQFHYVMQAAIEHLHRWPAGGDPPRAQPLRVVAPETADPLARNESGNALGGIRSPWVDVPTATLSGPGHHGEPFALLCGSTATFDNTKLKQLYPGGRVDYLTRFRTSLDEAIAGGFILDDDRAEIIALADASTPAVLG